MIGKCFTLHEECILVLDQQDRTSNIHNLFSNKTFEYDVTETKILQQIELGKTIQEVAKYLSLEEICVISFLNKIMKSDLGSYVNKKTFSEKIILINDKEEEQFFSNRPIISTAYLILEYECKKGCASCDDTTDWKRFSCLGCFKRKQDKISTRIEVEEWENVLSKLVMLNPNRIVFTGGDLFLDIEKNRRILETAFRLQFQEIIVNIGGDLVPLEKEMNKLIPSKAHIYYQTDVLNGDKIDIETIKQNLKILSNRFNKITLLLNFTSKSIKYYQIIVSELNNEYILNGILVNLISQKNDQLKDINHVLHSFNDLTLESYSTKRTYNSCLAGVISIFPSGKIGVCPRMDSHLIGKVDSFEKSVVAKNLNKYWRLSINKISPCSQCKNKYLCFDCRYIQSTYGAELNQTVTCSKKRCD